jgi:hypothetical protein
MAFHISSAVTVIMIASLGTACANVSQGTRESKVKLSKRYRIQPAQPQEFGCGPTTTCIEIGFSGTAIFQAARQLPAGKLVELTFALDGKSIAIDEAQSILGKSGVEFSRVEITYPRTYHSGEAYISVQGITFADDTCSNGRKRISLTYHLETERSTIESVCN